MTETSRAHVFGVSFSAHKADDRQEASRVTTLKRASMAGLTALITANIWTGAPLLALWIGSQVVENRTLSMTAVEVVVVVLAVFEFALALTLTWLNNIYDEITGRPRTERRATWLRSMRAEAEGHISQRVGVTVLERIVMINVYIAVLTLAVWYVFFAGPPAHTFAGYLPTGS